MTFDADTTFYFILGVFAFFVISSVLLHKYPSDNHDNDTDYL